VRELNLYCTSLIDKNLQKKIEAGQIDCLITIGGDGSMLRASRLCARWGVSILGINLGAVGFLMEMQRGEWGKYLTRLLQGDFRREERMMLRAQHLRGKQVLGEWEVVNEVVVCRGQMVKPIRLHASVDGYPMASYVADGLITATPTGSTAYALAAGGAIMPPELRNILVIPVAAHLSPERAIILSEGASVVITVNTSHEAVLSADGQKPELMQDGDCVHVEASERNISFIRFHDPGYFYRTLNRYMGKNPSTTIG
jgi:NAD+ kinase